VSLSSAPEVEGQVDEAIWVAQIHLHPVHLGRHLDCHPVRHNFHLGVAWLHRGAETIVVEDLIEEVGEGRDKDLSNRY